MSTLIISIISNRNKKESQKFENFVPSFKLRISTREQGYFIPSCAYKGENLKMKTNYENLPQDLKDSGYFCLSMKGSKIPLAKANDRTTFKRFNEVVSQTNDEMLLGIGIFDNLCCIDIDHCVNDNETLGKEVANLVLNEFKTYTEYSQSGKGLHILFYCDDDFNFDKEKYYQNNPNNNYEFYCGKATNKIITLTNHRYNIATITKVKTEVIQKFLDEFMNRNKKVVQEERIEVAFESDDQCLKLGLKTKVKSLNMTLAQALEEEPSTKDQSSYDLILLKCLAYWTNRNTFLMLNTFENSKYFYLKDDSHKEKWNVRKDYKNNTLKLALNIQYTCKDIMMKKSDLLINNIHTFFQEIKSLDFVGIPTTFKLLDKKTSNGFVNKSIVALGGTSSVGKTSFAINLALNYAMQGKEVIYISLDMSREQLVSKFLSAYLNQVNGLKIKSSDFFENNFDENQIKELLQNDKGTLSRISILKCEPTLEKIKKELSIELAKFNDKDKPIIFLDYVQLIQSEIKDDEMNTIKKVNNYFKNKIAIALNTIVFLIIANNRDSNKEGQGTTFNSGRGSSDIEYSSDYLIQLNFTEWERDINSKLTRTQLTDKVSHRFITLNLLKNRLGETGLIDFVFDAPYNTFYEVGNIYNGDSLKNFLSSPKYQEYRDSINNKIEDRRIKPKATK